MQILPLIPGEAEYRFTTTLADRDYAIRVYWNERDEAWYLDIAELDGAGERPVFYGIKVVLGSALGRTSKHPLFRHGQLMALDYSGTGQDATFWDFGVRVVVAYVPTLELAVAINQAAA